MNSLVLSLTVQSRWNCQQPITGPPRPPTFWLFPSGLVTATSSATVEPCIFSILFSHTNQPHVLLHYTHKSPVGSSSRHPAKHFQPQPHPFTSIFTITWLLHGQTICLTSLAFSPKHLACCYSVPLIYSYLMLSVLVTGKDPQHTTALTTIPHTPLVTTHRNGSES